MENKTNKSQEMAQEQSVVQYKKDVNDKDFRTSDGFFRDPWTGKELTGKEERVDAGTRTPRIKDSKGNAIPIAYKFWTKEEREAFKSGSSSGSRASSSKSNTKNAELREKLLGLQEYLAKALPDDKKVAQMIADIMPPDPEQEKLAKKVAGMSDEQKAMLKALLSA